MVGIIKKLYFHFVVLFSVLFLGSSAFADPRSWWSIREVTEIRDGGFTAHFSGVKITCYALVTLIVVAILNQPSVKKSVKTMLKIGVKKLQLLLNTVKTLLN
ncbi:hypothetical protein [Metabacillus rhizolycopersici]|uniref:Uncharacterized protein n=1 Tax=Metabacillus rhizolycopersici TaxID=2875709 RepID=A0ABS7UT45_9BACI|nr:hypothetical protein [Metabacillus rhizolycopersici]MBZ5751316.1 hypothetical protein [Metabacillus rhizolycopersici]